MLSRRLLTFALLAASAFAAEQWIKLDPTGKPLPGWANATAVYDTANNRMIVFGGSTATGFTNRVWVLANANGLGGTPKWAELKPVGGPPPPRVNHMAAYDQANNRLIVYGGSTTGLAVLTDFWVLTNANGLGGTPRWIQLSYGGALPSQRVAGFAHPAYDPRAEYRPGGSRRRAGGHFLSGREERSTTSGFSGALGLMVQKVAFWTGPSVTRLFPAGPPPAAQVLLVTCCKQQVEGRLVFSTNDGRSIRPRGLKDGVELPA